MRWFADEHSLQGPCPQDLRTNVPFHNYFLLIFLIIVKTRISLCPASEQDFELQVCAVSCWSPENKSALQPQLANNNDTV